MTYEGIEYVIHAAPGRDEWVLLISFPDNVGGNPFAFPTRGWVMVDHVP
jgi:hypothetical protein